ncbi:MAG: sulfatase, partial [Kiritimatiellaceae bacterium]|nr:sulfatase [Kiritimatiellaceae bacterium]
NLLLYPVAWIFQFPLILAVSVVHFGINHLVLFLPERAKRAVRFSLCVVSAFLFMGIYAASQIMYMEINTFIAWDALRVILDNALQLMPDIGRGNRVELVVIGILAIVSSLLYTRRYHDHARRHSSKLFVILCAAFMTSGAGGFVLVYRTQNPIAERIRKDLLPTTYLTFSIIDGLLPSATPSASFLADLVLLPQVLMDDYLPADSMKSKPHVFFILLESVSWDHYGFTGYVRSDVTPHLDELAQESLIFSRTYAAANHSNYAQTSTHSSQYPLRRKKLDQFENVDYPKVLLFDILAHAGYQTAFFSAQNEDWQGMKSFVMANTELKHFFHSKNELGNNIGIESKLDDALVCARAAEFIAGRDKTRPLFMYLNLQSTHFPYDIPDTALHPYQPATTDDFEFKFFHYDQEYLDRVVNKFDNALHYVDAQIGGFVETLKQSGLYENSLIVVASDHGEAFYKRGYPTHGTSLFEDQMRTACLFKLPGATRTETRTDSISLIDVNPTILEMLGQPNHPSFQGQQVLKAPRKTPIYLMSHGVIKSHGIVDYPWKYISSEQDGEWLLNLELDPFECTNFSESHPVQLEKLKHDLQIYQQRQMYYYTVLPPAERKRFYPPQH